MHTNMHLALVTFKCDALFGLPVYSDLLVGLVLLLAVLACDFIG